MTSFAFWIQLTSVALLGSFVPSQSQDITISIFGGLKTLPNERLRLHTRTLSSPCRNRLIICLRSTEIIKVVDQYGDYCEMLIRNQWGCEPYEQNKCDNSEWKRLTYIACETRYLPRNTQLTTKNQRTATTRLSSASPVKSLTRLKGVTGKQRIQSTTLSKPTAETYIMWSQKPSPDEKFRKYADSMSLWCQIRLNYCIDNEETVFMDYCEMLVRNELGCHTEFRLHDRCNNSEWHQLTYLGCMARFDSPVTKPVTRGANTATTYNPEPSTSHVKSATGKQSRGHNSKPSTSSQSVEPFILWSHKPSPSQKFKQYADDMSLWCQDRLNYCIDSTDTVDMDYCEMLLRNKLGCHTEVRLHDRCNNSEWHQLTYLACMERLGNMDNPQTHMAESPKPGTTKRASKLLWSMKPSENKYFKEIADKMSTECQERLNVRIKYDTFIASTTSNFCDLMSDMFHQTSDWLCPSAEWEEVRQSACDGAGTLQMAFATLLLTLLAAVLSSIP